MRCCVETLITHLTSDCRCIGKRCTGCEVLQCIEGFHKRVRSSGGRRSICKVCRKAESSTEDFKAKRREHDRANAEHLNEKKRARYHSDPERARGHARTYREKNPEKVKTYLGEYNRSNRGRARDKAFRERRPDVTRARRKTSWEAHKRGVPDQAVDQQHFTQAEWENLKAEYDYRCVCCGRQEPNIELTVDHIVPLTQEVKSTIENIQPLCRSCNSRKGTKVINYRTKERKHG